MTCAAGLAIIAIVIGGAVFVLLYGITGGNPFFQYPFNRSAFNRSIWLEDLQCVTAGNRRAGMADDIMMHQLKPGMTVQSVKNLLGRTEMDGHTNDTLTDRKWFTQKENKFDHVLGFYLGEELYGELQGHEIDRAWMMLFFDEKGQYVRGRIFAP